MGEVQRERQVGEGGEMGKIKRDRRERGRDG